MAKRLYILSIGTGGTKYITMEGINALNQSEVVVGYRKYVKELGGLLDNKIVSMSGMTKELFRCWEAIEYAKSGKTTSIISNGDANVFGLATNIMEMVEEENLWDEIEIISIAGVTPNRLRHPA